MIHGNQRYRRASLASTMCASRVFPFRDDEWPRSMLVYVAREWAKVSVKEKRRRLHRDPSIISRLYAAYALARRRPDFSTVSYFTPRATLSTVGRVEFSKTHSSSMRSPLPTVGQPVKE